MITSIINDQYKEGFVYDLPVDHNLAREPFYARRLELDAIREWANEAGVPLRDEYHISLRHDDDGEVKDARIFTYSYRTQMEKVEPRLAELPLVQTLE